MTTRIVEALAAPFPAHKIRWRVGPTTKENDKGIPLAYIDARDCMERLDSVVGPENWQRRYPWASEKKLCCEVGILLPVIPKKEMGVMIESKKGGEPFYLEREWVWKSDGAGDTGMESDKGAFSDAFKRACVNWGIARYLYDLPNVWMPIEPQGRSYGFSAETKKELARRIDKWQQARFEPKAESRGEAPAQQQAGEGEMEFTPEEADTLIDFVMCLDTKAPENTYGYWHGLGEPMRKKIWSHLKHRQREKLNDILKGESQ